MKWNELSMADRANYIKLGVANGIIDLNTISSTYNMYANGGSTRRERVTEASAASIVDNIYKLNPEERFMGAPSHNYNFTISKEEADKLGYYPDAEGHRSDKVKKIAHPTHSSRGNWNKDIFNLSDFGMEDPNYTLFGVVDGDQDPQAILKYQGSYVLPELTVTPRGNYINNSYDNIRLYIPNIVQNW